MAYIVMKSTGQRDANNLILFHLTLHHPEVKNAAEVIVNSGASGKQTLRAYDDTKAKEGSLEPIPEGRYFISPPIYKAAHETWPEGIGDRTMPLTPIDPLAGSRGAFEIHADANRRWSPGSAGCPVTMNVDEWGRVAYWVRVLGADTLYVDYGLGKVKLPSSKQLPPVVTEVREVNVDMLKVMKDGKHVGEAHVKDGVSYPTMKLMAALLGLDMQWDAGSKTIRLRD